MTFKDTVVLVAAGLGIWVAVRALSKGDAGADAGADFGDFVIGLPDLSNPVSRTVDRVGSVVTGGGFETGHEEFSLGVAIYDMLNPPATLEEQLRDQRAEQARREKADIQKTVEAGGGFLDYFGL